MWLFFTPSYSSDPKAPTDTKSLLGRLFNADRGSIQLTGREIESLISHAKITSYEKLLGKEWGSKNLWKALVTDPATLKLALKIVAEKNGWILNEPAFASMKINIYEFEGRYIIDSVPGLTVVAQGRVGDAPNWSIVLAELNSFRLDTYFAASESSDLMLSPLSAQFAANRTDLALARGGKSAENIRNFNEVIFENGKPLGDLFDSGAISLKDALKIVDQAAKFRSLIKGKPHDADLLQEYFTEISKTDFLNRSPGKHLKFLTYTAISAGSAMLNPMVGFGIAASATAFDTYLLPKITDQWKPNLFVRKLKSRL